MLGKIFVQQARGKDTFKYHEHTKRPVELMNKNDIILKNKANEELSKIFYKDAKKIGKYYNEKIFRDRGFWFVA